MYLVASQFRLLKRFLFLLLPYTLLRIGFYFYHLDVYKHFSQDEIFNSLLLGLRFDVAAICLLNIPLILLSLIPSQKSPYLFFERFLFVLINSAGIAAALIDYELFLFMGKRLSFDLFLITDDIWDQLPQLIVNFWYFPLAGFVFGVAFYYFDKKIFQLKKQNTKIVFHIIFSLFFMGACFLGIRGGLQHKSINVQSAFTQGKNELGHFVLNTPYHFLRTLKNQAQVKLSYFGKDEEAINIIMNRRDLRFPKTEKNKKNVVLIVLESFSLEYMEKGLTPFLDELKNQSVFFPHHLANGRRSIEALPSLLCGLPSLLDEPISKSMYQGNKFICMPKILKANGYTNYFFHGGSRGTMGFDSYTLSNGFDRYFSREDYPKKTDFDGTWGIFDGPYLEYAAAEIGKMPKPFMAGIFTLSSHQPYAVPELLKGKFPKGSLEIHESIGYADFALKNFFNKIKNESWFKDTVFFITSDHTSKLESRKFQNTIGHYRVPFLIYTPGEKPDVNTQKVTQHADIPRIMLNWVGIPGDDLPATSVGLQAGDQGYAINYADGREYLLISDKEVIGLSKEQVQTIYSYDWETGNMIPEGDSRDPLLKAYLQYFINGLINNNLSIYR
jgi:phosphoglycerol transferase MdoB-like AlkP superfamily enzyme